MEFTDVKSRPVILIIEPEKSQRDGLKLALERCGLSVLPTEAPHQARCILAERSVSAIITEIKFPLENGTEAVRALCGIAPHVPLVVTSAYLQRSTATDLKTLPGVSFMEKPLDVHLLMRTLKRLCRSKPQPPDAGHVLA